MRNFLRRGEYPSATDDPARLARYLMDQRERYLGTAALPAGQPVPALQMQQDLLTAVTETLSSHRTAQLTLDSALRQPVAEALTQALIYATELQQEVLQELYTAVMATTDPPDNHI
ncbi:hypothetical protein [Streptomyces sp. Ac-502]|uniref:hypothetical protein n=1 Tax=Streptomyces sp. Ac-502 TaxID=3342801 RepID=UPI0038622680